MSVVERARIVRVPTQGQLERALVGLLETPDMAGGLGIARHPGTLGASRRGGSRLRIARRAGARPELPPGERAKPDPPDGDAGNGRGAERHGPELDGAPGALASPAADPAPPEQPESGSDDAQNEGPDVAASSAVPVR